SAAFCLTRLASSSLIRSASPTFVSVTINSSRASCCIIALPDFGRSLLIFPALCSTKISAFDAMNAGARPRIREFNVHHLFLGFYVCFINIFLFCGFLHNDTDSFYRNELFSSSWVETHLRSFIWFYFFFVTIPFHFSERTCLDVATPAGLDALQEYIPASSSWTFVISKVAVVSNIVIMYFSLAWSSCSFLYQEISGNGFPITVHVNLPVFFNSAITVRCLRFLLRSSTCVISALICNLVASSSIILEAIFSDTFSFTLDFVTDSVMISSFSSEISAICSASFTGINSKTLSFSDISSGNFSSSIKVNTCPSGCFRSKFSTSPMGFNITISFSSSVFKCICFFFLHETSLVITSSVILSSLNGIISIFCTIVTSSLKSTTFFVRLRRQEVSIISAASLSLGFSSKISVSISDTGCNFMSLGSLFSTGFNTICSGFGSSGLFIIFTGFNRISSGVSTTFSFSTSFKVIFSFDSSSLGSFLTGFNTICSCFGSSGLSIFFTGFNRTCSGVSSTFSTDFKVISSFDSLSIVNFLTGFNTICSVFGSSGLSIFFTVFSLISSGISTTFSFSTGFKIISSFDSSSLGSFLTGFNTICSGFGSSGLSILFIDFNRISSGVSTIFSFSTSFKVISSFDSSSLGSFLTGFNTIFSGFGSSGLSIFFTGTNRTSSVVSSTFSFSTGFKVISPFDSSSLESFLTGFNTICSGFGSSGLSIVFTVFSLISSGISTTFSFSTGFKIISSFESSSLGSFLIGFNSISSGFGSSGLSIFFTGFNRISSVVSSTFSFSTGSKMIPSFDSLSIGSFLTGFNTICSGFSFSGLSIFFTVFSRISSGISATFSFSTGFKVISSFDSSSLGSFLTGFNTICSGFGSSGLSILFINFNRISSSVSTIFSFSTGFKVISSFDSSSLGSFLTGFNTIFSGFGSSDLSIFFTGINRTSSVVSLTFSFSTGFKVISPFDSSSLGSFLTGFKTICSGFGSSDLSILFTDFNRISSGVSTIFSFSTGFKVISSFDSSSLGSFLIGFNTIFSGFGSSGLSIFFTGFNRTSSVVSSTFSFSTDVKSSICAFSLIGFVVLLFSDFCHVASDTSLMSNFVLSFFSKLLLPRSMVLFDSRKLEAYPVKNLLMLFVLSATEVNHKFEIERVLFAKATIHHQVEAVLQMVNQFCREVKISELNFPSNLDEVLHLFQHWHPSPREPRNRLLFSL
ncbi:Mucin-19, partial [Trachymyrmex cornetzi]